MISEEMGKGFTYDTNLKCVTYSMKEYIRSKYSYNKGHIEHYLICVYLLTTKMHFYVNGEEDLEKFLFTEHRSVEHEEIQERVYNSDYTFSMESKEKAFVRNIHEGVSRFVLTDEEYEKLRDEQEVNIFEYVTFEKE